MDAVPVFKERSSFPAERNPILVLAKQQKAEWGPGKGSGIQGKRNHKMLMVDFSYVASFPSPPTLEDGHGPLVLKTSPYTFYEHLLPDLMRLKKLGFCVFCVYLALAGVPNLPF